MNPSMEGFIMSKNVSIDRKNIQKDLHDFLQTFAETITKTAADKITADAKASIEEYYLDYQPKYYNRTFDLLHNSFYRHYENHGHTYWGGVVLSPGKMKNYITRGFLSNTQTITKKEDVFKWTWLEGFHGYHWGMENGSRWIDPIQTTPPISRLLQRFNDKAFYENLKQEALSKAKKKSYKYLKF